MAERVARREAYRRMPWRNGRGFTLEITREPAEGEDFDWRLSLADIDQDGEFSAYPGYRRALVLIAGKDLRLKFRGHGGRSLGPAKRGVRFEGEWKTHCAIPQGRCTDLSLIVRRGAGRPASAVRAPRMLRVKSSGHMVLAKDLHGALFVIEGSVAVRSTAHSRPRTVRARDTLLLSPGRRRTLRLRSLKQSEAQLVLLSWRPGPPKITASGR
jgi:environmental stress-induced protein Ves